MGCSVWTRSRDRSPPADAIDRQGRIHSQAVRDWHLQCPVHRRARFAGHPVWLVSPAARELRRLGRRVTPPPRVATGKTWAALSPREREVAEQVAAGKTNREVAAALFLSEKTIESHFARIYDKLGLRSRTTLAVIIARAGTRTGRGEGT